jgi:hypothetical protein
LTVPLGTWKLFHQPNFTAGRFLLSLITPTLIAIRSLKKNSLSKSGALAAFVMGFIFSGSNWTYFICLFVFFISSSTVEFSNFIILRSGNNCLLNAFSGYQI